VHRYPSNDGCVDQRYDDVAELELFVPAVWVAVQQEAEKFAVVDCESDLVEIVSGGVVARAVEVDDDACFVYVGYRRFWLLIRIYFNPCILVAE